MGTILHVRDSSTSRKSIKTPPLGPSREEYLRGDRSDCGSESCPVTEFIDFLNPLSAKHPSYVKDTYLLIFSDHWLSLHRNHLLDWCGRPVHKHQHATGLGGGQEDTWSVHRWSEIGRGAPFAPQIATTLILMVILTCRSMGRPWGRSSHLPLPTSTWRNGSKLSFPSVPGSRSSTCATTFSEIWPHPVGTNAQTHPFTLVLP